MPINTALLSYGMSGKVFHAPFLSSNTNYNLIGAWERTHKKIQQDYPNTISYPSLENICNDQHIQLVIVNTPNYTHFEYAKKLMLAKKNIVVEKSFTTNALEAIQLKQIAKENNTLLSIYHNRRYDSDFITIQHVLKENIISKIHRVELRFEKFKPNLSPKLHKETMNEGSGILKDLGPHIIDQSIVLFGMPKKVLAFLQNNRANSLVDDDDFILLFYDNFQVHIYLSWVNRENNPAYKIIGENGLLLYAFRSDTQEENLMEGILPNSPNFKTNDAETIFIKNVQGKEETQRFKNIQGNYGVFYDSLYQSMINHSVPAINVEDGVAVMKIIDACIYSNSYNEIVEL